MNIRDTYLPTILQLAAGLGLMIYGLHVAATSALLFAYPFWIVAGILIAFPLAGWLASPFGSIFMSRKRFDRPQPMYSIPETLRNRNELDAAFSAYQKIAREYPGELKPYVEMIRMAFRDMDNPELAASVLAGAKTSLKKQAMLEELQREYDAISTMSRKAPTASSRRTVGYHKAPEYNGEKRA